jgi:hypothetical protein
VPRVGAGIEAGALGRDGDPCCAGGTGDWVCLVCFGRFCETCRGQHARDTRHHLFLLGRGD